MVSEWLLFVALFWSWGYLKSGPGWPIGCQWPPLPIPSPKPFGIGLLNTITLFAGSCYICVAEIEMYQRLDKYRVATWLTITGQTGVYFLFTQLTEFTRSSYCFRDSAMASLFYAIVGLHCIHVVLACIFITISIYFIMMHPLNYPTGTEYARKTGKLFPPIKDFCCVLEDYLNKQDWWVDTK